jgi:hypothetical protein
MSVQLFTVPSLVSVLNLFSFQIQDIYMHSTKVSVFSVIYNSPCLAIAETVGNSHYRLILKLGKEMQINHHS